MPDSTLKMNEADLIKHIRKRGTAMMSADKDNRTHAMINYKFINKAGGQWDEEMLRVRGNSRPAYEFNKLRVTSRRIANDMRANRPTGKVTPVEDGDVETAQVIEGLIRNVWNVSDADTIIDYAAGYQVDAGMGAWEVTSDYSNPRSFNQDIQVKMVHNPFCLFSDEKAKDPMKRDAEDWILTEKMRKSAYEKEYPDAKPVDFLDHEFDDDDDWEGEDEVRIGRYVWKEPKELEIAQLTDGTVVDADKLTPDMEIKERRTVDIFEIWQVIVSGDAVLKEKQKLPGIHLPFVVVFGEYMIVDGKTCWWGLAEFAKDAQRSYNVARTAISETIAMAPQAKIWATAKQAEGHKDNWTQAHQQNLPYILYTPDPQAPGAPQRYGGADVPVALIQESQLASEEINMVTGIYQHDVGAPNPSSSGRQEIARQQAGQLATFNYPDNLTKGIQRSYEIMIGMLPEVYDAERKIRILGEDMTSDYKMINTTRQGKDGYEEVYDLRTGQYDVTVTTGPSFATRRQEAAETYQQLFGGNEMVFPLIADLLVKSMDLPYAEKIAERLATLLPPEVRELDNQQTDVPPQVMAMMQQAEAAMAQVQEQMQVVEQASVELETDKAGVEKLIANLDKDQAQFEAKVAQEVAKLAKLKADLTIQATNDTSEGVIETVRQQASEEAQAFNAAVAEEIAKGIAVIQAQAEQITAQAAQAVDQIRAEKDVKPRVSRVTAKRENGELVAIPEYEDDRTIN